jgi:NTE family protein
MGNPVLFPFFRHCRSDDVIVVQINPIVRAGIPKTAREIMNRVNEITFNSSLLREFRAIDFVDRLLEEGRIDKDKYKHVLVHRIDADQEITPLGASSKLNAEWPFLSHLFDLGRNAAMEWLNRNFEHLGKRSTLGIRELFDDGARERAEPPADPIDNAL